MTDKPLRFTRRRLLIGAAALTAGGLLTYRFSGYRSLDWQGQVLSARQALILAAAAEALLPPIPGQSDLISVAERVDRYALALTPAVRSELDQLFLLIEHGPTPLLFGLRRFTRMGPEDRERFLSRLAGHGGLLAQAYRGLRDLCMLGYYQQPATWPAIGYEGPSVPEQPRIRSRRYATLVAAPGQLPRSLVR